MVTLEMEKMEAAERDVVVRAIRADDLEAVVRIDAESSTRQRPQYFEVVLQRAVREAKLQISLVAQIDERVVGFVIGSLYYGEYGLVEPTASIDAIGVESGQRRKRVAHALMQQLRSNLGALGVAALRTEVSWSDFDLLAFFKSEGFAPAPRICLECSLDPTAPRI